MMFVNQLTLRLLKDCLKLSNKLGNRAPGGAFATQMRYVVFQRDIVQLAQGIEDARTREEKQRAQKKLKAFKTRCAKDTTLIVGGY